MKKHRYLPDRRRIPAYPGTSERNITMEQKDKIIVGCMRLNALSQKEANRFLDHALDAGVRWFDHADIYGGGQCEEIFGRWLRENPGRRGEIVLQSKCSIIPGLMYDCSREHILSAVEGILKRLGTDRLDVLLLHRPDALMEPEEVAEAFDRLYTSGKVARFGVSNFSAMRLALLQKYVGRKLEFDQMQFGPAQASLVRFAMEANNQGAVNRDGELLDYCMLNGVGLQAWSPLQYGMISGCFLTSPDFAGLTARLTETGAAYGVSPATVAAAWILRHPAGIQVISGSMKEEHFDQMAAAREVHLTRKEWYEIYTAGGNPLP